MGDALWEQIDEGLKGATLEGRTFTGVGEI